ncbi:MAG: formate dehydrogenase accessory sulfurtransferase FdhD [Bacteroidales bacterium]
MAQSNLSKFTSEFEVIKVNKEESCKIFVPIASEVPITITGNGIEICTLMCSPCNLKELSFGFLYNSGFINDLSDIRSFDYDETKCHINLTLRNTPDSERLKKMVITVAGKGIKYTGFDEIPSYKPLDFNFRIEKEKITAAMEWFQDSSKIYKATGCVHSSALSANGNIPEIMFEDVARHNSVDKVIGSALIHKVNFSKCMLFCSCRISSEILNKAGRCEIPVIVSLKTPTHQAIILTKKMKLTLIGLVKEKSFIIYTNPERVIL